MACFSSLLVVGAFFVTNVAAAPCDIFADAKTPCIAAHAVTRALYAAYDGPLYKVIRDDNVTLNVTTRGAGGVANAAAQDTFCEGHRSCKIATIWDQSPRGNHLYTAPARHGYKDLQVDAAREALTLDGSKVYAAYFEKVKKYHENVTHEVGVGYRNDKTSGVAVGDEPETIYMVTSGTHYNGACCFDYGNAETGIGDGGAGTMEAISWTNGTKGMTHHGVGKGPWVMADLEQGLFGSNLYNHTPSAEPSLQGATYVVAMVKGDSNHSNPLGQWALKGGDATVADGLKTLYDGVRPFQGDPKAPKYSPMRKKGGIILGIGGDNTHGAVGTFYEGAMTTGYSTDAADAAVHADIVAAGYGK